MSGERRQRPRLGLTLPVRVSGFDHQGQQWTEMSTVLDVSSSGVSFLLKHPAVRGNVLHLLVPLPKRFRSYDLGDASYHVYGLVRSARTEPEGTRVGVLFLGKHPPRGFEKEPAAIYLLPDDPDPARPQSAAPQDRRVHRRLEVFVNVVVKRLDGRTDGATEERTIAENIGRGGARVLTSLLVLTGDVVFVQEVDGDFRTRAEVRHVYVGPDHVPRLCLHFLDAEAPPRLVSA
ncbi:MAG: PilZ domain-containing protein [Vicinamibacteria bacterium]